MRAVKVYGQLAKRLGQRVFRADVASPAEAVRFLCANFPGLDQWLIDSEQDGIGYRVTAGRTKVDEQDFSMACSDDRVISITPVLAGAGGFGKILLGIGLIALSFAFPGAGAFAAFSAAGAAGTTAGTLTAIGNSISLIGASMVLGGVAQLISPPVSMAMKADDPRKLQSYSFSGIQNTSVQGTPIPCVYGKMFVGSILLSASIATTDAS
jgi:predicted phage tail protein